MEAQAQKNASGAAEAVFTAETIGKALETAGQGAELRLKAEGVGQAGEAIVRIPAEAWGRIDGSGVAAITIDAGIGSVSLDRQALAAVSSASSGGEVAVSIKKSDAASQAAIAGRPVYDFAVTAGGKAITSFGGSSIAVSVPYQPTANEDHNAIVIYYVTGTGELVVAPNSVFDPATGTVKFSGSQLSRIAVGYRKVSFADTAANFAADEITYLAARNVLTGVGPDRFSPSAKLTRGDLMVILARMAGADIGGRASSSFIDVESGAYYASAVAWAAENGIAGGVGNGLYKPKDYVTREQFVTLIARYAEHRGYTLPKSNAPIAFADQRQVSGFAAGALRAAQQAGLISGRPAPNGDGTLFAPQAHASRAEAAKMIALLMKSMLK